MRKNNFIRNYYPLLIVAVGFVLVLLIGFFVFRLGVEKSEYYSLCKDFPNVKNEISCEEAIKVALEKYDGEVQDIKKTVVEYKLTNVTKTENVWFLTIPLRNPIEIGPGVEYYAIEVTVDMGSKKTDVYSFKVRK